MTEWEERETICRIAKTYVGTPYRDCAKIKGAGADCATLLAMVYEEAGVESPIQYDPYSPQWYLHRNEELYLNKVLERAREITEDEAKPADIVMYKFGRCFSHGAIIVEPGWPNIIHAFKQAGIVTLGNGATGQLQDRERRFFTRKRWGA